ncbi:MAG: hypothetical protein Fur0022_41620 [Anaerolineales bacterium]
MGLTKIEVQLSQHFSSAYAQVIETIATDHGLMPTLKGTLQQFPGCIHWHFKRGKEKGVLEITFWPQELRAWISVHDNRKGAWMEAVIPILKAPLERSFYEY